MMSWIYVTDIYITPLGVIASGGDPFHTQGYTEQEDRKYDMTRKSRDAGKKSSKGSKVTTYKKVRTMIAAITEKLSLG